MSVATPPRSVRWSRTLAAPLRSTLRFVKFQIKAAPLRFPRRIECNVCGWAGARFLSDNWHKNTVCPKCRAEVRHRLLFAALQKLERFRFERLVKGRRVLHFAPEPVVQEHFRQATDNYVTADFLNPRRDLQLDISDMPSIKDGQFDLLIACDVLEHVADDRRAMREIYRCLSPGGCAILTVPQKDNLQETFEDPSVRTDEERERVFGQRDHLRIYGEDFPRMLNEVGFETEAVCEADFHDHEVQHNVLFPPELSTHPLATNYRKVFFARKPAA